MCIVIYYLIFIFFIGLIKNVIINFEWNGFNDVFVIFIHDIFWKLKMGEFIVELNTNGSYCAPGVIHTEVCRC